MEGNQRGSAEKGSFVSRLRKKQNSNGWFHQRTAEVSLEGKEGKKSPRPLLMNNQRGRAAGRADEADSRSFHAKKKAWCIDKFENVKKVK